MKKKILIILIALIGVTGIIVTTSVLTKKNYQIINEEDLSKMFAIKVNDGDGSGFKDYTENKWPDGYILDTANSICEDFNGNTIADVSITYDKASKKVKVNSDKTAYCYLYFITDKVPTCNITSDGNNVTLNVDANTSSWYFYGTHTADIIKDEEIKYGTDESNKTIAVSTYLGVYYYYGYVKNDATGLTGTCAIEGYRAFPHPCGEKAKNVYGYEVEDITFGDFCTLYTNTNPTCTDANPNCLPGFLQRQISFNQAFSLAGCSGTDVKEAIKNEPCYSDLFDKKQIDRARCLASSLAPGTCQYVECTINYECSDGNTYSTEKECIDKKQEVYTCQDNTTCTGEGCCEEKQCANDCDDGYLTAQSSNGSKHCYRRITID